MNEEPTTWGKFVTNNRVRPQVRLKTNIAPDIAAEMDGYTWGKFVTNNTIPRERTRLTMHRMQPYLKMTLSIADGATLTDAEKLEQGTKIIAAVIAMAEAKGLSLAYSTELSKVEDGKLIAALLPIEPSDDDFDKLDDLVDALPVFQEQVLKGETAAAYEVDYKPVSYHSIRANLDLLHARSRKDQWTDATKVPPSVFPPIDQAENQDQPTLLKKLEGDESVEIELRALGKPGITAEELGPHLRVAYLALNQYTVAKYGQHLRKEGFKRLALKYAGVPA